MTTYIASIIEIKKYHMDYQHIIQNLESNKATFESLLLDLSEKEILFKTSPEKWCLLEIICHLYDEEREDFRTRVKQVLESPNIPLPPIDPVGWVKERNYIGQDYSTVLTQFLKERDDSIIWLKSLVNPKWNNAYHHPKVGPLTAKMYLSNWLAHDFLHIRQITRLKYDYLMSISEESLDYAGNWV
ncbi:DinB family protein [Saprospiraceae bacterium]|nr:DinB family protein [Saprospiraceae bacterium]